MGACTVTAPTYGQIVENLGTKYFSPQWSVHLSNSYAAGGDTITTAQVGFGSVIFAMLDNTNAASQTTYWIFKYNATNGTIQAFTAAAVPGANVALVEVQAGTDLSAVVFQACFIGV